MAERLGMTVAELGERMSIDEFTSWIAFDKIAEEEHKKLLGK